MDSNHLQIVIEVISFIFGLGLVYGTVNARLKSIEKELHQKRDISERLTRIEEQTKLLIDHFIKK
jgi:uncharacterized membrane protein